MPNHGNGLGADPIFPNGLHAFFSLGITGFVRRVCRKIGVLGFYFGDIGLILQMAIK